jgi:hypothetical protein
MKKIILFLFLILTFAAGLSGIYLFAKSRQSASSVGLPPPPEISPSPVPGLSPAVPQPLSELEKDLQLIESDLKKMKEDTRLTPPNFIFTLGLDKE